MHNCQSWRNCFFPTSFVRKNLLLKYLNNKFFSIYNYLFRFFFLYSVFNEHLHFAMRSSWKLKVESWKLSNFPFFIFHFQLQALACMVEMMGFEPMTPCLQGRCSPSWATPPKRVLLFLRELCLTNYSLFIIHHSLFISKRSLLGRPKWTRTTDLVLIRHAL